MDESTLATASACLMVVIVPFVIPSKLIIEIKEKKQWTFDWIKVVAIGIPSLYMAMMPILLVFFGMNNLLFGNVLLLRDTTFTTIAGIVFGYVLLSSLKNIPLLTNIRFDKTNKYKLKNALSVFPRQPNSFLFFGGVSFLATHI